MNDEWGVRADVVLAVSGQSFASFRKRGAKYAAGVARRYWPGTVNTTGGRSLVGNCRLRRLLMCRRGRLI